MDIDRFDDYNIDDWLNDYREEQASLNFTDQAKDCRVDYREESQIYADYLDYVEEWEWHSKETQSSLLSSYIQYCGKTHQNVYCSCSKQQHTLTTVKESDKGDVVVDHPTNFIYAQCWFKQLTKDVREVLEQNAKIPKRNRLTPTLERVLHTVAQWKMVNQDQTPFLLPFDAYKELWWNKDLKGKETTLSKFLTQQITQKEKEDLLIQRDQALRKVDNEDKRILLHFPHSEHGFHILYSSIGEAIFSSVWSFMNVQRKRIDEKAGIKIDEFFKRMKECELCKRQDHIPGLSPQGIYYAPPGSGKTTMAANGLFVGFDTDWIGIGPSWLDYGFLLRQNIPIITNQYTRFLNCGLKVIGVVRTSIRKDARGIPLGRKKDILSFEANHSQDMNFRPIDDREFFTHYANQIKIQHHLQSMIRNYSLNLLPFYQNEQDEEWLNKFPKLLRKQTV